MKRVQRLNKVLLLLYFHLEYRQSGLERRPSFGISKEHSERVRIVHMNGYFRVTWTFFKHPIPSSAISYLGAEDRISPIMSSTAVSAIPLYCTRNQFPGCYGSTGFSVATRFVLKRLSVAHCLNRE